MRPESENSRPENPNASRYYNHFAREREPGAFQPQQSSFGERSGNVSRRQNASTNTNFTTNSNFNPYFTEQQQQQEQRRPTVTATRKRRQYDSSFRELWATCECGSCGYFVNTCVCKLRQTREPMQPRQQQEQRRQREQAQPQQRYEPHTHPLQPRCRSCFKDAGTCPCSMRQMREAGQGRQQQNQQLPCQTGLDGYGAPRICVNIFCQHHRFNN